MKRFRKKTLVAIAALAICLLLDVLCAVASRATTDVSLVHFGNTNIYLRMGRLWFDRSRYLNGAIPPYNGHILHVHHEEGYFMGKGIYWFSSAYAYRDKPPQMQERFVVSLSSFTFGPVILLSSLAPVAYLVFARWFRREGRGFEVLVPKAREDQSG